MCGCARPCLPAPHWPGAATQRRRQRRRPTLSARTQRRPGRRCRSPAPRPPAAAAGTAGRPPSARPGPSRRPPPAPAPRARTRRHARAPIRASLCQQARRHAMRVPGCPGSAAPSAQAARAGTPCTCRGASVASGAGGRAGHAKRCCRPASTAACDAPTTTAVWPASSGARPGLSTTPRPCMPAHARRELASLPRVSLLTGGARGRASADPSSMCPQSKACTDAPARAWATHVLVNQHGPPRRPPSAASGAQARRSPAGAASGAHQ